MKKVIFDVANMSGTRIKEVRMTISDDQFKHLIEDGTKKYVTITLAVRYTRPRQTVVGRSYVDVFTFNYIPKLVSTLRALNLDEWMQKEVVKQVKANDRIEDDLEWFMFNNDLGLFGESYTSDFADMLFTD